MPQGVNEQRHRKQTACKGKGEKVRQERTARAAMFRGRASSTRSKIK